MKQHERTMPVYAAYSEATAWLLEWAMRHDLTTAERVAFHARELESIAKYAIRAERHPDDPGKPGDTQ